MFEKKEEAKMRKSTKKKIERNQISTHYIFMK